jgi:putative DNA methylase
MSEVSTISAASLQDAYQSPTSYPKRLIEVDIPIRRISAHARREKDMRRGHVPLLYIWPATRPPAACRAVLCAALWPDPVDPTCSDLFRRAARESMQAWARDQLGLLGEESYADFVRYQKKPGLLDDGKELRAALLHFIADFANADNATKPEFLDTARRLTSVANSALGGLEGARPLVFDPFAGGGAIPLEALRIGADAFGSDLNPVAALLNKVVLEFIPKYGIRLSEDAENWVRWAQQEAKKELSQFYPNDPDGAVPIAYLAARWIICEGPGCGSEVPLMRGLWLARKGNSAAVKLVPDASLKKVKFEIIQKPSPKEVGQGTIRRGSATCPACGYTTPVESVRRQLRARRGGTADARLFCVVTTTTKEDGRCYRAPNQRDFDALNAANSELERQKRERSGTLLIVPDEALPPQGTLGFRVQLYGMQTWGDLFTPRQCLALATYARLARENPLLKESKDIGYSTALASILALMINRLADLNASLCGWQLSTPNTAHVFTRWALPMMMDFGEINPLAAAGGSPESAIRRMKAGIEAVSSSISDMGTASVGSAVQVPLPDHCAAAFVTDPPYYDAVPYADLSDFFYVWLKRTLPPSFPISFHEQLSPKDAECIVDPIKGKDRAYFESTIRQSMVEARRVLAPYGIGLVVFAHKSTAGWEAQLQAMVEAGWTITASWPIDTEMESRLRANNSAVLASSIHIVCRPRELAGHSQVGDWRDVLQELPKKIAEWMPRLAHEGVVGADAIFACLGPALELFSRYEFVEKANGERVSLKEYLTHVWAAVAREALAMVFSGADASGFEEDARLTAMWLWTLSAGHSDQTEIGDQSDVEDEAEPTSTVTTGFVLEFDAARKIAQGLGARLESLTSIVEVKGESARLLPVSERTRKLFGKDENESPAATRKKKAPQLQLGFLAELEQAEEAGAWGAKGVPSVGTTALDRVHQSMILFAAGRGEALRRFLVDEGVGRDERFWRLAQVLSYLYPSTSEEKRWIDGVLARKKGLGF